MGERGLAAVGRHGGIEINLLEPLQDDLPWLLQLDGGDWHLALTVTGPNIIQEFSAFVKGHTNREHFAELRIGSFGSAAVLIVKDDEFADRFWLRVLGTCELLAITIIGQEAEDLEKALADISEELFGAK